MNKGMYEQRDWDRVVPLASSLQSEPYRSEARRDSARLLHSPVFRRLQGKLQLFPSVESDFFRNRLTHSLEVGQIAKSIAIRLNETDPFLKPENLKIDSDLVELAGWAHDLGHPPFGHTGEEALDNCMLSEGGFEGNAQTLRILAKLEKKSHTGNLENIVGFEDQKDCRVGLNLTFRTLASILKYDKIIPIKRSQNKALVKGYYSEEQSVVQKIKSAIVGEKITIPSFKTVECSIMDVADDIAYSTYDLEDAFKSKFLSPFQLIAADGEIVEKVRISVGKRLSGFTDNDVRETLKSIFVDLFEPGSTLDAETQAIVAYIASRKITDNGYYRSNFTSKLVGGFVRAVKLVPNKTQPALSKIEIDENSLRKIEVLKHFAYQALILSPDLKVTSYRGREITEKLFNILSDGSKGGYELLPNDVRMQYEAVNDELLQKRIVCDFIAGMTDRYAVEYYGRLTSEKPQTLFKPLF